MRWLTRGSSGDHPPYKSPPSPSSLDREILLCIIFILSLDHFFANISLMAEVGLSLVYLLAVWLELWDVYLSCVWFWVILVFEQSGTEICNENVFVGNFGQGGNILRSIPFVMSGHLIFNFFLTLGTPVFSTYPNNGCPKRIYQHSGQAQKHFSHRFHGVSFLADV